MIIMFHHENCPHCNKLLRIGISSPDKIGTPFKKCPRCGGTYVDRHTREWVNRSPAERKLYCIKIPLLIAIVALICLTFLFFIPLEESMGNSALGASIGISVACAVALFFITFFARRPFIRKAIEQSLERTKSESYVQDLEAANFRFYPIDGVDIGTVKDVSTETQQNTANTADDSSDNVA